MKKCKHKSRNEGCHHVNKDCPTSVTEMYSNWEDCLLNNAPVSCGYDKEAEEIKKHVEDSLVHNVAVAANYGAGKSSAINTYLKNYRNKGKVTDGVSNPEKNGYARITLAAFNEENEFNKNQEKSGYNEEKIERSILQQLLYSRSKCRFPNSGIRRTGKTPWHVWLFPVVLTFFVAILALPSLFFQIKQENLFSSKCYWPLALFCIIAGFVFLLLVITYIVLYVRGRRIKVKDLEVDVKGEDAKSDCNGDGGISLISRFVDEILYFFECVDVDLVIFEDLDRWNSPETFSKLRELNTIVNTSRKRKGKVTFLYAIRNDLFKDAMDRAKFFDAIVSIVPVINPMSAKYVMIERNNNLKSVITEKRGGENFNASLSDEFITGVYVYIPDMRILNNTFNDYLPMFGRIFDVESYDGGLTTDNLFALCLYKNLFPADYALLESNKSEEKKGVIPTILHAISYDDMEGAPEMGTDSEGNVVRDNSIKYYYWLYRRNGMRRLITGVLLNEQEKTGVELGRNHDAESEIVDNGEAEYRSVSGVCDGAQNDAQPCVDEDDGNPNILHSESLPDGNNEKGRSDEKGKSREMLNENMESQIDYLLFCLTHGYIDKDYDRYAFENKTGMTSHELSILREVKRMHAVKFDSRIDHIDRFINELADGDFLYEFVMIRPILENFEIIKGTSLNPDGKSRKYTNMDKFFSERSNLTKIVPRVCQFIKPNSHEDQKKIDEFLGFVLPRMPEVCCYALADIDSVFNRDMEMKKTLISAFVRCWRSGWRKQDRMEAEKEMTGSERDMNIAYRNKACNDLKEYIEKNPDDRDAMFSLVSNEDSKAFLDMLNSLR